MSNQIYSNFHIFSFVFLLNYFFFSAMILDHFYWIPLVIFFRKIIKKEKWKTKRKTFVQFCYFLFSLSLPFFYFFNFNSFFFVCSSFSLFFFFYTCTSSDDKTNAIEATLSPDAQLSTYFSNVKEVSNCKRSNCVNSNVFLLPFLSFLSFFSKLERENDRWISNKNISLQERLDKDTYIECRYFLPRGFICKNRTFFIRIFLFII